MADYGPWTTPDHHRDFYEAFVDDDEYDEYFTTDDDTGEWTFIHGDIYDAGSIWTDEIFYSTIKRWSYDNWDYRIYDNENYYQPILIRAYTKKDFNDDFNCRKYDVYLSH